MSLFKKEKDIIDIPELQRRGLIKKDDAPRSPLAEYAELSSSQPTLSPQEPESSNPLGFLDTFAAAVSSASKPEGLPPPPSHDPTEIADVKVKLEDFEYKLERFTEKLVMIEAKLEEFENKGL